MINSNIDFFKHKNKLFLVFMRNNYLIIGLIILILNVNCSRHTQSRRVLYLYRSNDFLYKNILRYFDEVSFAYNIELFKEKWGNPEYEKQISKIHPDILIFETENINELKDIIKAKSDNTKLYLITRNLITNLEGITRIFTTDFSNLGYKLAKQIWAYSFKNRNTVVFLCQTNFYTNTSAKQFFNGCKKFLLAKEIKIYTNFYSPIISSNKVEEVVNEIIYKFPGDLRAIIVDNVKVATEVARYLRKIRKEMEYKTGAFGVDIEGIHSLLRTEITVLADEDKFKIYKKVLEVCNKELNKKVENLKKIYYIEGRCYNQVNVMDTLAETKLYSLEDVLIRK